MEDNKKDYIILKTGWNEAVREVLNILNAKYNNYINLNSVKNDIQKLLDVYKDYNKKEFACEILKYYESKDCGFIILNFIDKIEGYYLDLKNKIYIKMNETDCLFDLNNLKANVIEEFSNEEQARNELNKILSNFKKAEE